MGPRRTLAHADAARMPSNRAPLVSGEFAARSGDDSQTDSFLSRQRPIFPHLQLVEETASCHLIDKAVVIEIRHFELGVERAAVSEDTLLGRAALFRSRQLKKVADRSARRGFYTLFRAADDITNQPQAGDVNLLVHLLLHRT